jgi:uncharacterized C2H2 Zn-finger protein
MKQIIKEGKLPETQKYQRTCLRCGTVFTYQNEDLIYDQRDGDFVTCPVCTAGINHNPAIGQNIE